ncbi:MAG: cyclase family protein [Planctomycetia bacterium]|nr:cyclase family protein [Planctomycetia bacterium]
MPLVDLTRVIREDMSVYPGDPYFGSRAFAEHALDGFHGACYQLGSHLGTHLDAPFHYFIDGESLDSFPLDFFTGDAVCLDLRETLRTRLATLKHNSSERERRVALELTPSDLQGFEVYLDSISIILLCVDWHSHFGAPDYYTSFPSITPETADWLADYPKLRILGLETPSLSTTPSSEINLTQEIRGEEQDASASQSATTEQTAVSAQDGEALFDAEFSEYLPTSHVAVEAPRLTLDVVATQEPLNELELCADAECHRILLGRRPPILPLEGLVDLERLPLVQISPGERAAYDSSKVFEFFCFPLPISGADGCPVRAVARTQSDACQGASCNE